MSAVLKAAVASTHLLLYYDLFYSLQCHLCWWCSFELCDVGVNHISVFKFVVECHLVLCVHHCSGEFSSLGRLSV